MKQLFKKQMMLHKKANNFHNLNFCKPHNHSFKITKKSEPLMIFPQFC